MRNIQVVDDLVQKTELLFEKFYNDKETAFIFTADHGMSNIGNHGDGSMFDSLHPLRKQLVNNSSQIPIARARRS